MLGVGVRGDNCPPPQHFAQNDFNNNMMPLHNVLSPSLEVIRWHLVTTALPLSLQCTHHPLASLLLHSEQTEQSHVALQWTQ